VTAVDNRLRQPLAAQLADDPAAPEPWGDWTGLVRDWRDSTAGRTTIEAIDARLAAGATVYPADPLRALKLTPRHRLRAVILGQDPYHGHGQAEGLAFSVPDGTTPPPSLRNIAAELARDGGPAAASLHSLVAWAEQGVLLLNTSLTVEDGAAGSHTKLGWQALTARIVESCAEDPRPIVFLLWGSHAQQIAAASAKAAGHHGLFVANHPSPLSARRPPLPFIGCGHFTQLRDFLVAQGSPAIDWSR
jgi:uracil-DNA glycosylase